MELTPYQVEIAKMLGKYGGFGHRYIASVVLNRPRAEVTVDELQAVQRCLSRAKVRVTDWRQGLTTESKLYSAQQVKRAKETRRAVPKKKAG